MTEITLRTLVEQKIERAIAAGEDCPFPPCSAAAAMFREQLKAQHTHGARPSEQRVEQAQVHS